jgi:hypothetical protein
MDTVLVPGTTRILSNTLIGDPIQDLNLMQFLTLSYKMKHEHTVEKKDKDGNSIYENGCCNG